MIQSMKQRAGICLETRHGQCAVVLYADRMEATFIPALGMVGTSLRFDGEEYLSFHGGVAAWKKGHTTGLGLLHPWANRLAGSSYRVCGKEVSLRGAPFVHRDPNRLPIHGTMIAQPGWEITRLEARRSAVLDARFDFAERTDLLRSFPFPHVLDVRIRVRDNELIVTTGVTATRPGRVPVSFGWHPYFRLPGVARARTTLLLPPRRHLELDRRMLPTGASTKEPAEAEPLGRRFLDDAFKLGRERTLGLGGAGKGLTIELDAGYPYAQVYAPVGKPFVALEPMTAPINALVDKSCPKLDPGERYEATFTIRIGIEGT